MEGLDARRGPQEPIREKTPLGAGSALQQPSTAFRHTAAKGQIAGPKFAPRAPDALRYAELLKLVAERPDYIENMPIDRHHALRLATQVAACQPAFLEKCCAYLQLDDAASIDHLTDTLLQAFQTSPTADCLKFALPLQIDRQSILRLLKSHGGNDEDSTLLGLDKAKHSKPQDFEFLALQRARKFPIYFAGKIEDFTSRGVAPHVLQNALLHYASHCLYYVPDKVRDYFVPKFSTAVKHLEEFDDANRYGEGFEKSSGYWNGLNLSDPLYRQAAQALASITNPEAVERYQGAFFVMQAAVAAHTSSTLQGKWMEDQKFVPAIMQIRAPDLAYALAVFVPRCVAQAGCMEAFEQPPLRDLHVKGPLGSLMRLTLANLAASGVDILPLVGGIQTGPFRRTLRDDVKMRSLMALLMQASHHPDLSPIHLSRIVEKVIDSQSISALSIFARFDDLEVCARDHEDSLVSALDAYMKTKFSSADAPDNVVVRIAETFGVLRQPDAIWQYMAGVEKSKDKLLNAAFKTFFFGVLNDNLPSLRYDVKRSLHLQALQAAQPGILEDWRTPLSMPLIATHDDAKTVFNSPAWLLLTIMEENHLQGWVSPELAAALDPHGMLPAPEPLLPQRHEAAQQIFQLCLPLLQQSAVDLQIKHLQALKKCLYEQAPEVEFHHDVSGKIGALRPRKSPSKNVQGIFTDSYRDLLLCGNEVDGSCQRTDGAVNLNKGLLGYLLHGQTAMVAAVDAHSGRISSRAILRLLLNERQRPILFMEPPYGNSAHMENVKQVAIAKATAMGLPLTHIGAGASCESALNALAGPAPYEYCDTVTAIAPCGQITIRGASFLYRPR
jgi:hypothetical protein